MTNHITDISPRTAALVAGFGLLLMAVLAFFANFFVLEGLIVAGDAASTTANIRDDIGLFRLGVAGFLIIAVLDIVVAAALYVLLKPVNERLALFMASLRLVYAGMLGIALLNLALVSELVGGADYLGAFEPDQLNTQVMFFIEAFNYGWLIGLVFFGLHLLALGYLAFRSGFVPAVVGILLMIASVAYVTDSFANIVMSNYADYETVFLIAVAIPGTIGELSLMLWLLLRGGKVEPGVDQVDELTPTLPRTNQPALK